MNLHSFSNLATYKHCRQAGVLKNHLGIIQVFQLLLSSTVVGTTIPTTIPTVIAGEEKIELIHSTQTAAATENTSSTPTPSIVMAPELPHMRNTSSTFLAADTVLTPPTPTPIYGPGKHTPPAELAFLCYKKRG